MVCLQSFHKTQRVQATTNNTLIAATHLTISLLVRQPMVFRRSDSQFAVGGSSIRARHTIIAVVVGDN